ncbi:hypothetical protein EC973_004467, partial [Apophysomyces ossiformis]
QYQARLSVWQNYSKNRDWLEARKDANNIDDIEASLSEGSPRSTYDRYREYLRQLKTNDNGLRLWKFYSNRSVHRRTWDNAISQSSCLDKACYLITNQARRTFDMNHEMDDNQRHVDEPRLVYAFGLDGMSRKSRREALAPMDHKIANALYRKINQKNRNKDRQHADVCTRVDEYLTSKVCCRCSKEAVQDRARLEKGQEKVLRVVQCANCGRTFHRDGNAADNQATIARYMLRFQQRPRWFIRPSRCLEAAGEEEAMVTTGRAELQQRASGREATGTQEVRETAGPRRHPSQGTAVQTPLEEQSSGRESTGTQEVPEIAEPRRRPSQEAAVQTPTARHRRRASQTETMVEPPRSRRRISRREEERPESSRAPLRRSEGQQAKRQKRIHESSG